VPHENFIVDVHPLHRQVIVAAGLSGHGLKFAPLIGTALADLAQDGKTVVNLDFLKSGGNSERP
jgi:glycine/D-amino acid oxidase-like deaminating enzyme